MIKVKSCAKINFFLDIKGRDKEGYHLIETVMTSIGIGDTITVKKNGGYAININCKGINKQRNTAFIAAKGFQQKYGKGGFDIDIIKGIPIGGGLGGSSADAAGVLFALSEMFNIEKSALKDICLQCGSDVFYMLSGGYAKAEGRGEAVTPFECNQHYDIVIAKPAYSLSTAKVYALYDKLPPKSISCAAEDVIKALRQKDFAALKVCCQNALYPSAKKLLPQTKKVYGMLKESADAAFMSGSGSACVGIFESKAKAEECAQKIALTGYYAVCTKSQSKGIEIIN